MTERTAPIITIIGGGFTGSTIAVQQARHYISLFNDDNTLPPLTIRLIDKNSSFGPGLPYDTQDDVFLLNQPAYAMSPFPEDTDHFTRWLGGDENVFATRRQYGDYLKETLSQTFNEAATAGIPVVLEKLSCEITDLTHDKGRTTLSGNDDISLQTQVLVLATGHYKGGFLNSLDQNRRYFSGVYSVADVDRALKGAHAEGNVAVIGTGQSMMDALAVLDCIGYKGRIYAISRHLAEPWPFDPALYKKNLAPYVPHFLDPQRVKKGKDLSFRGLRARLCREFSRAERLGYGTGHVLTVLDFQGLAAAGPDGSQPEGLEELRGLWEKIYGNPTPPERHALLERYKKSGQLRLLRNEVRAENIDVGKNGFIAHGLAGKKPLNLTAIFNAAAFDRRPLASPLLQKAADKNLLHLHDAAIQPGQQHDTHIFVAGPPASPHKWGVETLRNENAKMARQSVEVALGLGNKLINKGEKP